MAQLLEVTFQDVNQLESKSSMWVENEETSADVIVALKAASNAKIIKATLSEPLDLSDLTDNVAVAANVETVTSKAIIQMRGVDADSTGEPQAHVRIGIPAPLGSLINGLSGDITNEDVQGLMAVVLSKTGVAMDTVESIKYNR